jgi:predicted ATP-grasp superfamily ATP-dependent carboligase
MVQMREDGGMRFPDDDRVVSLGRDICRASGYHGVAHIDMRIDERTGQVNVIEFNPRFWGSLIYASWMGVNFLEAGVAILERSSRPAFQAVSGFCPFLGASPGVLAHWAARGFRLHGLSSAQQKAWSMQVLDPMPEWIEWANDLRQSLMPGNGT